jgi:fermentation-respiration switch protein FrsA (DUF1100 family)
MKSFPEKAAQLLCLLLLTLTCQGCVGRMFYYPDHKEYDTPARHGLKYEEVAFASKDGTRLSGWFIPAVGPAKGTVIHFHGNAQNMTAHFGFVDWLPAEGFNLFVFDYRGYGKSAGSPSRRGIYEDSLAALDYIRSRPGIDHDRLLVLGQSLGGAQAITAVGSGNMQGIRAVVVESTFFSYRSIVKDKIGAIPLLSLLKTPLSYLLIGDDLSPADFVAKIAPIPLLLIYGTADDVIPYQHGPRLLELARAPKELWRIDQGGHTEAFIDASSPYRKKLVDYFLVHLQTPR